ncbi:MAG TPA: Uma2 family endonuclease [Bryobacteraceae bacterium]|nr:Uma2 family endonuclease [Bryobacteraceae bacterium]
MSSKLLMDVDEYLHTSFDGADREYLDGEVVERNMGELEHGDVQGTLTQLLRELRRKLGIRVAPEVRIRIGPTRYRIPDISVWRDDNIGTRIPSVPPFLAIEILSSDDRMNRMLQKIKEYLAIGVAFVWVIDPEDKSALIFSGNHPEGVASDVLRTSNPDIDIPLSAAFDLNH